MMGLSVIVCGAIRSDFECSLIFKELILARREGLLDRIVFCTWTTEVDSHRTFIDSLHDEVEVVTVLPIKEQTSFNLQVYPFYTALSLFDDDQFVARVRTDKCFPLVRTLVTHSSKLVERSREVDTTSLFSSRIVVAAISWNEVFAHGDFFMLARASDLRLISHFDSYFDMFCAGVGAESRWFSRPFIQAYPDIRAVFESVSLQTLCKSLYSWANQDPKSKPIPLPPPLGRVLGQYFLHCARNFALINDEPSNDNIDLIAAIGGRDPKKWQWTPRTFATTQDWLDRITHSRALGAMGVHVDEARRSDLTSRSLSVAALEEIHEFQLQYGSKGVVPWPGTLISSTSSRKADSNTYTEHGNYLSIVKELIKEIDSSVDTELLDRDTDIGNLTIDFRHFPAYSYYEFRDTCRDAARKAISALESRYGTDVPVALWSLPALFFVASLVFSWDSEAGEWLADQLLADKLTRYFAPVTKWGIMARYWSQTDSLLYKVALMSMRGIGGPVSIEDATRLLKIAADRGNQAALLTLETIVRKTDS